MEETGDRGRTVFEIPSAPVPNQSPPAPTRGTSSSSRCRFSSSRCLRGLPVLPSAILVHRRIAACPVDGASAMGGRGPVRCALGKRKPAHWFMLMPPSRCLVASATFEGKLRQARSQPEQILLMRGFAYSHFGCLVPLTGRG
ncbi:hypothetical protein PVAP13_2NG546000 [Panicum virgatum]|uniref:Uncharacterized protein n=1 Tax=Panicum virgatum TaxID=38727 RepID=A0A8T0W2U8_PANVG|nr:hypothetical protein PVAP13_2NG546000 [Panicum virgatum]